MALKCFNVYANPQNILMNIDGDNANKTFKYTFASDLLYDILGGAVPTDMPIQITQDSASQGLTATTAVATALGVTTCTITFNKNLATSDPFNGPFVQVNMIPRYNSE